MMLGIVEKQITFDYNKNKGLLNKESSLLKYMKMFR